MDFKDLWDEEGLEDSGASAYWPPPRWPWGPPRPPQEPPHGPPPPPPPPMGMRKKGLSIVVRMELMRASWVAASATPFVDNDWRNK